MGVDYHARFKDCPWHQDKFPNVSIGGVGGIGSWLAFFLGRIGANMDLYDFDTIDYTNMGGQLYPVQGIGRPKTKVIKEEIRRFSGTVGIREMGRLSEKSSVHSICFAAFDSITARRQMFEAWKRSNEHVRLTRPQLFVDGRMTVESFQMYIVTPDRLKEYEETLFDDSSIPEPACSLKATSHIGAMIGSVMTQAFTNYMTNYLTGMDMRDLPFEKRYETMFLDYIN